MQSHATQLKKSEANGGIEYHWCKWIFDNLLNGCTPESMEKTIAAGTVSYSAKNLMCPNAILSKKSIMHELNHAWHLNNYPENHKPIVGAYRNENI